MNIDYRIIPIEESTDQDWKHAIYQIKIDQLKTKDPTGLWIHVYDTQLQRYVPSTKKQCQQIITKSIHRQTHEFYSQLSMLYGDLLSQIEFIVVKLS